MLIDTHAHLWFDDYVSDLDEVLARANEAEVEKMIVPGTNLESSKKSIELSKKFSGRVYAAVGIHPEELGDSGFEQASYGLGELVEMNRNFIVAIGEVGTDASTQELKNCMGEQKELFRKQCEMALEYDLPVIIHTRNSLEEALEVLDSLKHMPRGQFHCFSHDEEGLKEVLSRGFYVSFCGNISWSKRVARLVPLVPMERLLLETDSPLMVPRDKKGEPISGSERNEPSNVRVIAQQIAILRGQTVEKIAEMTTTNAISLYQL